MRGSWEHHSAPGVLPYVGLHGHRAYDDNPFASGHYSGASLAVGVQFGDM